MGTSVICPQNAAKFEQWSLIMVLVTVMRIAQKRGKIKSTKWNIYNHLKTEEEIYGFIETSIKETKNDTDPKYLIQTLEAAIRARGMLKTAKEADVVRASLYRILTGETDPRSSTLAKIANFLGYRLTFIKQAQTASPC